MRRWSLRILLAVVIALILAIAITQAVLSLTTIPDRIVLIEVQQQLGLRMTAKSVDTGWFGDTVIKDVTLSLPLADGSLLATPELRVRHTWLPVLLFTRKLTIDLLTLDDAQIVVTQDAAGRWNLQDLVELLARTGGKQQAAATSTRRSGPKLPGVIVHNGTLTVTDRAGKTAKLAPLEFSGLPDGLLVWRYDAKVASLLTAVGKLSPGFEWAHEVDVEITDAGALVKPWVGDRAGSLNVAGRWEGELKDRQIVGRLVLNKLQGMGIDVSGVVRARVGDGTARVEPQKLLIKTPQKLLPEMQVSSGTIELVGTTIRAQRVQVSALAGMAQVDGRWALDSDVGEIVATWDEIVHAGGVRHSGRLSAAVADTLGNRSVTADLTSNGAARGGHWRTQMKLTGGGRDWHEMNRTVAAPALSWNGPPRDVVLDGLVARLTTRGKVLELTTVQLPGAERIAGKGMIDFANLAWSVNLAGRGWPVPRFPESTLEFRVDASGDAKLYKLNELFLSGMDVLVDATGFYDRAVPKPLLLNFKIRHAPTAAAEADTTLRGTLYAEARVQGIAWPLDVGVTGRVIGQAIRVKDRAIGDLAIDVEGNVTPTQASITSKELELLGGHWALVGTWLREQDLVRLNVRVRDLPLAQCGAAIGRNDVEGTMDGKWTFDLPNLDKNRLTMTGGFEAHAIRVGAFPVERAAGTMTMKDGRVEAGPIDLTQGTGKATANVSVALAAPTKPTIGLTAADWPVALPGAGAALKVSADTKLDVDVATRSATGPLTARADVTLGTQPFGQARLAAELAGHAVRVTSLEADAFAGSAVGNGQFDLDNPLGATAEFTWRDIDAAAVAAIFPRANGIAGRFGGSAKLRPSNDARGLEPVRLDVVLDSYGGNYRGATVGDGTLTAFLNYETGEAKKPGFGDRFRIVLADTQDDPSLIRFADGIVRIWARFGRHRGITTPAGHLTLELDRLDLNQLVHVGAPDTDPKPGRVSGTLNLYGSPGDVSRLSGIGALRLTDSDLVNLDVFEFLYSKMNVLNWGNDKPQLRGHGSLDLRFEADTLYVNNVRYVNRGTEIRAQAVVREVWKLPNSPLFGTAVGSVRPFSSLKLPLLADVDDVLAVIQRDVTSVVVEGTVQDPKVRPVPFGEIGAGMRSLLLGDVQEETRGR
jgi:hypothetical protein